MAAKKKEQHIAVFGEQGSGKTVLLSSFYGANTEPSFTDTSSYKLVADDTSQHTHLLQNYLKMKNTSQAPEKDRFAATRYSFTLKPRRADYGDNAKAAKAAKTRSFSALRLVWHDYPGEWFEEEPSSEEEGERRVATFTSLLKSDVALVLVDGQKLLDYEGQEDKYLKAMLRSLSVEIEKLKEDILPDGKPLAEFPRIWILALSKADLHPDLDVRAFHDLIVEKAASDVTALRETLRGFVQLPQALSIGEDFMLLSSAKFEPDGKIEVSQRVGIDLVLPIACMLPLERISQWAERFEIPLKVLGGLVDNAEALAAVLTGVVAKFLFRVPKVGPILSAVTIPALMSLVDLSKSKLEEIHRLALDDQDYLAATLAQFRLDLDRAVEERLLVKSPL